MHNPVPAARRGKKARTIGRKSGPLLNASAVDARSGRPTRSCVVPARRLICLSGGTANEKIRRQRWTDVTSLQRERLGRYRRHARKQAAPDFRAPGLIKTIKGNQNACRKT